MVFKRICECGEETSALYFYQAVKEGKFDQWSEIRYYQDPYGYKYEPVPCSINCIHWENFVPNEEGVPYEKNITEKEYPPNE